MKDLSDTPMGGTGIGLVLSNDESMSTQPVYVTPKLDGNRVALRGRLLPDQHKRAHMAAYSHGLSLSEYVGALIDRDAGLPNKLDDETPGALFSKAS